MSTVAMDILTLLMLLCWIDVLIGRVDLLVEADTGIRYLICTEKAKRTHFRVRIFGNLLTGI